MATFNAGLAVGLLPNVNERVPHVVDALVALDVDLLFVQELWLDRHWDRLRAALGSKFPHDMRPAPARAEASKPCAPEDVASLVECASRHCAGLRDEALARCVVRHCAHLALTMPAPCLNCIAADPSGTMEDVLARCAGGSQRSHAPRSSARYGGLMAYGGSFGTGILSRYPLEDRDTLVYESTVNARCGLHARIDVPALGAIDVFATHFSPGGAEHPPQVEAFAEWTRRTSWSGRAIVLGDLNMSPGSPSFRLLERAGFRQPDHADRRGTYSSDGLERGVAGDSGWRLDHVLVRDLPSTRTARVLDDVFEIEVGGGRVRTTLSDHFGIVATIG